MRVLYRLIPLIPTFFARPRALELIARERDRAEAKTSDHYVLNELLAACAESAGDLQGESGALALLEGICEKTMKLHGLKVAEQARSSAGLGSSPNVLFETLSAGVVAAGKLKAPGSLLLVRKVSEFARAQVTALSPEQRADIRGGRLFYPCRTLIACARACANLGETAQARANLDFVLQAGVQADGGDRLDLLLEVLKSCQSLEGREAVLLKALALFRSTVNGLDRTSQWEGFFRQLETSLVGGRD